MYKEDDLRSLKEFLSRSLLDEISLFLGCKTLMFMMLDIVGIQCYRGRNHVAKVKDISFSKTGLFEMQVVTHNENPHIVMSFM